MRRVALLLLFCSTGLVAGCNESAVLGPTDRAANFPADDLSALVAAIETLQRTDFPARAADRG